MQRDAVGVFLSLLLMQLSCASEPPLEFAHWRIDVPEGTPIREYGPVPIEERDPAAVQLIDDLVIGGATGDPNSQLYRPRGVVAAGDGRIYIADAGRSGILVFGADGDYSTTLGREGEGPGEFRSLTALTMAGDRLVAYDARLRRFSVWDLDGRLVDDSIPDSSGVPTAIQGLADGHLVSHLTEVSESSSVNIARHTIDGSEVSRYVEADLPPPLVIRESVNAAGVRVRNVAAREVVQRSIENLDSPRFNHTIGTQESVYVSPVHEYQVIAFAGSGEPLWALRVAWPRAPMPESRKQSIVDRSTGENDPPISVDDFQWPPLHALEELRTDGSGNLYVFPAVPTEDDEPPGLLPVDVYSPDGEFLAAGLVPHTWSFAVGDYVYGLRTDERAEVVVVRCRLVLSAR